MALSDEWEDEHLTPGGWVSGSYKHDHGHAETKPVPPDTVVTVRKRTYVGALGARPEVTYHRKVVGANDELIAELEAKYGQATFGC